MADLTRILAEAGISIDAVLQKEPGEKARTDIVIITHLTREKYVNAAIDKIEQLSTTVGRVVRIRLETARLSANKTPMAALQRLAVLAYCLRRSALP